MAGEGGAWAEGEMCGVVGVGGVVGLGTLLLLEVPWFSLLRLEVLEGCGMVMGGRFSNCWGRQAGTRVCDYVRMYVCDLCVVCVCTCLGVCVLCTCSGVRAFLCELCAPISVGGKQPTLLDALLLQKSVYIQDIKVGQSH
jgi:hypothetical protein